MRTEGIIRTAWAAALALAAATTAACRDDRVDDGSIRVPDNNRLLKQGMAALADEDVVKAMRTPDTIGRIVYDPPVDLSYANAQRMRPDLVRPDTVPRRDTSAAARPASARGQTGGDASRDTSGGAARAKTGRP